MCVSAASGNVHPRYCVYLKDTATLKIFRSHDDSLMDKSEATLIVTIAIAKAGRHKEQNELAIRTHEGETVTCVAPSWEARRKWLDALSTAQTTTLSGYLFLSRKKQKDWKRRWVIYQRETRVLCLYQAREYIDTAKDKKKNSHAIYAQAIEAPFRGSLVVSHSVKKAAPKLPFGFMCYSDDGQAMHLSADGPEDMGAWMSAMELQKEEEEVQAAAPSTCRTCRPPPRRLRLVRRRRERSAASRR